MSIPLIVRVVIILLATVACGSIVKSWYAAYRDSCGGFIFCVWFDASWLLYQP